MRDAFRALLLTETAFSSRAHAHALHEIVGLTTVRLEIREVIVTH
jgi:hypothetical protein